MDSIHNLMNDDTENHLRLGFGYMDSINTKAENLQFFQCFRSCPFNIRVCTPHHTCEWIESQRDRSTGSSGYGDRGWRRRGRESVWFTTRTARTGSFPVTIISTTRKQSPMKQANFSPQTHPKLDKIKNHRHQRTRKQVWDSLQTLNRRVISKSAEIAS